MGEGPCSTTNCPGTISTTNPCTFTSRCVNKCFGNKTFVSIPRGFFAILLSHDGFFYQEVLTMMQSEAAIHVPTPGCRKHAFLPERNGRTEERSLTISNSILERSLLIGNNNGGALWCWTALPLGARPILRKCGQTLRKCRRYPHPVTRGSCQEFLCTAPVQTTHAPQIGRAPPPPLVGTRVVWVV